MRRRGPERPKQTASDRPPHRSQQRTLWSRGDALEVGLSSQLTGKLGKHVDFSTTTFNTVTIKNARSARKSGTMCETEELTGNESTGGLSIWTVVCEY